MRRLEATATEESQSACEDRRPVRDTNTRVYTRAPSHLQQLATHRLSTRQRLQRRSRQSGAARKEMLHSTCWMLDAGCRGMPSRVRGSPSHPGDAVACCCRPYHSPGNKRPHLLLHHRRRILLLLLQHTSFQAQPQRRAPAPLRARRWFASFLMRVTRDSPMLCANLLICSRGLHTRFWMPPGQLSAQYRPPSSRPSCTVARRC